MNCSLFSYWYLKFAEVNHRHCRNSMPKSLRCTFTIYLSFIPAVVLCCGGIEFFVYETGEVAHACGWLIVVIGSNNEKEWSRTFQYRCFSIMSAFLIKTMRAIVNLHLPDINRLLQERSQDFPNTD